MQSGEVAYFTPAYIFQVTELHASVSLKLKRLGADVVLLVKENNYVA